MNKDKMELEEAKKMLTDDNKTYRLNKLLNDTLNIESSKYYQALETVLQELERYKQLAEAKLRDSKEFQDNMCEHRCILKSELQEIKENSIPKEKIKKYLDKCIVSWRKKRDRENSEIAKYYIDAFQSVRTSMIDDLLN